MSMQIGPLVGHSGCVEQALSVVRGSLAAITGIECIKLLSISKI